MLRKMYDYSNKSALDLPGVWYTQRFVLFYIILLVVRNDILYMKDFRAHHYK